MAGSVAGQLRLEHKIGEFESFDCGIIWVKIGCESSVQ